MAKNSFVLQTRLNGIVAKLSDKQAGVLFKSILNYALNGTVASFEDSAVDIAFEFVRQDIDYSSAKYNEICKRNADNGKLGGRPKKQTVFEKANGFLENPKKANGFLEKHNDNDVDIDNDIDKLQLLTAEKSAEQAEKSSSRKLNNLQIFSNRVIEHFEPSLQTKDQKGVWFKRNCRCLSDILKFCGGDIDVALECIAVCAERLEKAGLQGGYEAVCRNLSLYYEQAVDRVNKWRTANEN